MFAQSRPIQFSLFDIFSQVGKWNKILTRLNIMILDQLKFYDTEDFESFSLFITVGSMAINERLRSLS